MTDPRTPLFDAVRPHLPGGGFTDATIAALHLFADTVGLPRAVVPAAASAGDRIPADYFPLLADIESGNNPMAKAGTSSASGLYQFIRATWLGEGGSWGKDMSRPFGGLTPTREEQDQRARSFTAKNARALAKAGIPINKASLYAAHFAGVGTAAKLIGADVGARADRIAGEAATKANRSILEGKTVAEFLTWLHKKTGDWAR